jgi:hypothetical protein
MEFIDTLAKGSLFAICLTMFSVLSFFIMFGIAIFSLNDGKRKIPQWLKYGLISCASIATLSFMFNFFSTRFVLYKAEQILSDSTSIIVILNGVRLHNLDVLINSWEKREYIKGAGSHPVEYFDLDIKGQEGVLHFRLGPDSRDTNLYWVHFPKFKYSSELCYLRLPENFIKQ